ncbi:MAG: M28 family peptidase [Candidatus Dadabacteria bacterium]|nr:MAG: M28 family peptidase [Candidatus Dadabacteria bacterium]
MNKTTVNRPGRREERQQARRLIRQILDLGRRRLAGSDTERRAHELLDNRFHKLGLDTELTPFWTNQSLYQVLALHFGLAIVASVTALYTPWLALLMHVLAGVSYIWDSTKKRFVLRQVLPIAASQNLIARQPVDNPRLRIVLAAHADASFTGKMFDPEFVRKTNQRVENLPAAAGLLRKGLAVATYSCFALAVIDLWIWIAGLNLVNTILLAAASIPAAITFLVNYDVVRRNEVVPGANDNLSGCASLYLLAKRLDGRLPDGVEIDYVVTGAEEPGLCGARALRRQMRHRWDPRETIFIAVDTICNGELRIIRDGEVVPLDLPGWALDVANRAAQRTEGVERVEEFEVPVGATDAAAFAYGGYEAFGLTALDPDLGAPANYHWPTDDLEHLDFDDLLVATDFLEHLVDEIIQRRVGETLTDPQAATADDAPA